MTAHLHLVRPNNENRSVGVERRIPTRSNNRELRQREHLTSSEVEKLISAAQKGRYGDRDATLILVPYRHGLRAVELAIWNGHRPNLTAPLHCTFAAPRTASRPPTRSAVTSCAPCVSCSAIPAGAIFSKPNAARPSPPMP